MKTVDWRPYQPIALDFLRRTPRANLHAFMGAGKTLIVETLVKELQTQECTLILGPLRVARKVWSDCAVEWEHLRGLKVATITGDRSERLAALATRAHVHTMNYENIEWLLSEVPAHRWPFSTVVADESTKLKGFRTRQGTKRAGALATIAQRARRWINLTGTPAPNGLQDLWGQQWFVDFGEALGTSFSAFQRRWFYKSPVGGQHAPIIPFQFSQVEIEARLRPTTIALRAEDWFDVDKPQHFEVRVELPAAARQKYKQMARTLLTEIENRVISAANAGVKSQKLLQLASGAVYDDTGVWRLAHDAKIEALESIVEEAAGAPILVAYNYVHEAERILLKFKQARMLKTKKDEDEWNRGKIPILVAHPASAGHGLNLQHGGHRLVYFGHTWNLEWYQQILERIGPVRQMQSGYDRPVMVYSIVADNTMDEAVIARNAGKASVMDALMQSLSSTA
jgi:SNF2 family DNA or RNA helicase